MARKIRTVSNLKHLRSLQGPGQEAAEVTVPSSHQLLITDSKLRYHSC